MDKLKNTTAYLAGPVESSKDPNNWRKEASTKLKTLNITPWDPLIKPRWVPQIDGKAQAKMKEDIPKYQETNKMLRKFCLHLAANATFIIVKIDKTFTVRTFEEIAVAKYKPVFVISEDIPSMWLVDQLDAYDNLEFVFHKSIDSLMDLLKKINRGEVHPQPLVKWPSLTYDDSDYVGMVPFKTPIVHR